MRAIPIYILRGAFVVARFDKLGNAKASTRGTGNRTGSTFFMLLDVEPITNLAAFWEPGRTNGTLISYSQQSDGAD